MRAKCKSSPGRVKSAITVAASDKSNKMAKFSNFGKCVDIFAPGVKIISASSKDPQKLLPEDGTSMASPLVAGVIAVMMSQGVPADQVRDTLINNAAKLSDAKNLRGTPNALVSFRNLLNSPAPPPPGQEGPPTGGDAPPAAGKEAPAPNKEVSPPPAGQETPPQNQEGNVNTSPQ
ncbi:peptidase S8/S53 domain-containing protein [Paraphysoderma sedebokerense]|nr:peptidase S8/S53 domain-containing protein [Paraphysoderma sedebokerense]